MKNAALQVQRAVPKLRGTLEGRLSRRILGDDTPGKSHEPLVLHLYILFGDSSEGNFYSSDLVLTLKVIV